MNFNNILFLDIETVSQFENYASLSDEWKELWDIKANIINRTKTEENSETAYPRSSIYAEFGKVVCISCGYIQGSGDDKKLVIRSYYNHDEKVLLREFADMMKTRWTSAEKFLCAHNGKEFDYPYLCRRMVINGISLPEILNITGKKPWDIRHLDTMDMWKFGDYKSYTSLKLLAKVLGIPSPKDDIDGSRVNEVYWADKDLERIAKYCQKDVSTLAQVFLRFHCEPFVKPENVLYKNG